MKRIDFEVLTGILAMTLYPVLLITSKATVLSLPGEFLKCFYPNVRNLSAYLLNYTLGSS